MYVPMMSNSEVELELPKEPVELKQRIKSRIEADRAEYSDGINWEAGELWWGNELQSYLWEEWKDELKPHGFTWQKFQKLLSYSTDKMGLWVNGNISWEEVVRDIENNISELGSFLVQN